jgi:formyltetrahydrofolate deformylase
MAKNSYILTLSCPDKAGIVASVSDNLFKNGGFIVESAQFGDFSTNTFFMRTEFESEKTYAEVANSLQEVSAKFSMNLKLHDKSQKQRVLIAVSKSSHCLNHLLYKYESGTLPIEVCGIVSNHQTLKPMAEGYKIPFFYLPISSETKHEQERQFENLIKDLNIDLVVLARYMQILSNEFSGKLKGKAINIHHSFLPSFIGANPYQQAYDRGVKIIGATAHYVTEHLDEGPIIEQEVLRVDHSYKAEDLRLTGQDIESGVLFEAIKLHVQQRVLLNGNKTVIFR